MAAINSPDRVAEDLVEEGRDEGGGALVGLGAEFPQGVRLVQNPHQSLLLRQRREGHWNSKQTILVDARQVRPSHRA